MSLPSVITRVGGVEAGIDEVDQVRGDVEAEGGAGGRRRPG